MITHDELVAKIADAIEDAMVADNSQEPASYIAARAAIKIVREAMDTNLAERKAMRAPAPEEDKGRGWSQDVEDSHLRMVNERRNRSA